MKIAIVNLAEQFGVKALKQRPCVILEESKKHTKVILFTHKPVYRKGMNGIIPLRRNYLDTNDIFIVRNEYVTEKRWYHINKNLEKEIRKTMKSNPHNVYCVNYNEPHRIEKY